MPIYQVIKFVKAKSIGEAMELERDIDVHEICLSEESRKMEMDRIEKDDNELHKSERE